MSKSINNGERIFDWAQQVMQVGFVQMINRKFAGLVLHDKRDAKAIIALLDELLGELTHIENVTETGLGIPLITVKESSQYQDGAQVEQERIIELLSNPLHHNIQSPDIHKDCYTCVLVELIKGEQK